MIIETELSSFIGSYGGFGLIAVSFIAATIFPLSSELAVVAAEKYGMPSMEVLLFASIGNCLGIMFNYWLGRWGSEKMLRKSMESRAGKRALAWSERYGKWGLLLSWLPVVGDPLTLVAGILKVPIPFFLVVACTVRVLRYGVILFLLQ